MALCSLQHGLLTSLQLWQFFQCSFVQCSQCPTFNSKGSFHPHLSKKPSITSCPCCWTRVFSWSLGIFPMPSILRPLFFLGSCFFRCATGSCPGCENNVNCEPQLSNFPTATLTFLFYDMWGEKGENKYSPEIGHWYYKRVISN